MKVFTAEGPVRDLLYYEAKNILVTVTNSMMLSQHLVSPEGDTREMLKVCFLKYRFRPVFLFSESLTNHSKKNPRSVGR